MNNEYWSTVISIIRPVLGDQWINMRRCIERLPTYTSLSWPTSSTPSTFVRNTATFVFLSSVGPMLARPHCWSEFAIRPRTLATITKEWIWCVSYPVLEEAFLSPLTAHQLETTSVVIRSFVSETKIDDLTLLLISAASTTLIAPSPLRATHSSSFMTLRGLRPETTVSWRKFKRSLISAQSPLNQMNNFMPFGQLSISFFIFLYLSATAGFVLHQICHALYWNWRRGSLMSNGQEMVFSSSSLSPYLPLMEI